MNLYDSLIRQVLELFQGKEMLSFPLESSFPVQKQKEFIFPDDAQVELGGKEESTYFMGYTSNPEFVNKNEILLLGKDISSLPKETPFAHLSFFLIDEEGEKDQDIYRLFRNLEYSRYKVAPMGYMLRINTNSLKEGGRVSKEAIEKGISIKDIGMSFLEEYKKEKRLRYVKQIFITDPSFDYKKLLSFEKEAEGITVTFDHILKTLKMDCRTCSFKEICDTVEGMREMHQKELNGNK